MPGQLIAGLFPGQGSQAVGMGRVLVERFTVARDTFAQADELLGFALTAICFDGPAEELKRTAIVQPALLTLSTAYWRVLEARGFSCAVVAGHSLGEYSALVAAGALCFPEALGLVRRRGKLMEEATTRNPGSMLAVLGISDAEVLALCEEVSATSGVVAPANYNAPGQVVVSGETPAVTELRALAKTRGMQSHPPAGERPVPLSADGERGHGVCRGAGMRAHQRAEDPHRAQQYCRSHDGSGSHS